LIRKNEQEEGIMDLMFYVIAEIVLVGVCIGIAQHRLSYNNLQWISAMGMLFFAFFVLRKIALVLYSLFKSEDDPEKKKRLNKTIEEQKKKINNQEMELIELRNDLKNSQEIISDKQDEITALCDELDGKDKNNEDKDIDKELSKLEEKTKPHFTQDMSSL
jgi:septal ring factor EnvC (AmiA/AmiB activator)